MGPRHQYFLLNYRGFLLFAFSLWQYCIRKSNSVIGNISTNYLFLAALTSAAVGFLQFFGFAIHFYPLIFDSSVVQVYANLRQKNHLASLLNMGMASFLYFSVAGCQKGDNILIRACPSGHLQLFLFFNVVALISFVVAATGSRTGLLQVFFLVILRILWIGDFKLSIFIAGIHAASALSLAYLAPSGLPSEWVFDRVQMRPVDCNSRITLWSNVLTLIAQKPLLGWGWNELDYAHFITLYSGERFCDILDNAHNLPLHLAVELGVPVALGFCALFVWWIARNKPWRETDATRQTCWAILMVIGIHSLLEYPLWYAPFQITTLICLLILWQTRPDKAATPPLFLRIESVLIRGRILISASLLVVCAFAAWNYHVVSQIYLPAEERSEAYRVGTLEKVQGTLLFQNHALFAKLTLTPLTLDNANSINALAKEMLHHSPEPRVIEPLVKSAVMLGRQDEALYFLQRYKAAFPAAYEKWVAKNGLRASSASAATHSP